MNLFKPGDVVRRIGPSHPRYGMYRGRICKIKSSHGTAIRLIGIDLKWAESYFQLCPGEEKKRPVIREVVVSGGVIL